MSTVAASPPKIDRFRDGETRIVLKNIDWATYASLCDQAAEQHVRMTYDRGTLELMSPSSLHEMYKVVSGYFIDDLVFESDESAIIVLSARGPGSVLILREGWKPTCATTSSLPSWRCSLVSSRIVWMTRSRTWRLRSRSALARWTR